jgi:hypothetical protein
MKKTNWQKEARPNEEIISAMDQFDEEMTRLISNFYGTQLKNWQWIMQENSFQRRRICKETFEKTGL